MNVAAIIGTMGPSDASARLVVFRGEGETFVVPETEILGYAERLQREGPTAAVRLHRAMDLRDAGERTPSNE